MKTDNDISQLIQAAKNNNQEAIEALVRIGAPSVAPLMEAASIGEDHLFVQPILKKMGLSAIEPLLSLLHHKDDRTRVLAVYEIWIIISVKKIEIPEAVEPLIKALTDNEKGVRSYSALVLGEIKDKRATEYLIQSLGDNEEYVKESVVKALGKIGDRRAVDPLVNCFKKEKGSLCRSYALDSLAEIGGVEVVDPLIQALNDKDDDVRFHAASGLGLLRDPRVVGPLIQALKDNSPRVRWRAALSLGEIGDIRAVEPLNLALKDKNVDVQKYAAEALASLGKSHQTLIALEEILRSGKNVNTEIVKKIIDIGGIDAVPILLGALMDNNPDVYNAAAWGIQYPLMKIRGVNIDEDKLHKALIPANEYLISIIQGARISKGARSYDNRVAKAIGTLGAIGDTKSIPVLEQILSKIKINIKKYGNIRECVNTGIAAGYISTQNDISHIETAIEEIKQREKLK